MSELLNIALSGLVANQVALSTTGHNIANAGVDGYSRQRVDLGARTPQLVSGGFAGRGVEVETIERTVSDFVTKQLRADSWVYNARQSFRIYAGQVDSVLSDPSLGLSGRIDSLFSTFQAAASDPAWLPNRQVAITQAESLATSFNEMHRRLSQVNASINTELDGIANDVDTLARSIADLNLQIANAIGASGGDMPNDLLDRREQQLLALAELVDVVTVRDGNAVNVLLGRGQALVVGGLANRVTTVQGRFDPSRRDLAIVSGTQTIVVSDQTTGGKAGGILEFRSRVLDQAFNEVGRVAIGIAAAVNEQHALGVDLEGELGGLFFAEVNAPMNAALRARPAGDNAPGSSGTVAVTIDDASQLTASSYRLDILAGGAWRLFRTQDASVVASGASLADPLASVDGFTLDLNLPAGTFADGDSFLIEPTRLGAREIALAIARPEDLALAQPVRATPAEGNLGAGSSAVSEVFDTSTTLFTTVPGQLSPPLVVRFSSATTYDVLDATDPANPAVFDPALIGLSFTPGVENTLFSRNPADPGYLGFQMTIAGNPEPGDSFAITFNTGTSDNRNAVALAKLQIADTLAGGTASFQGAYGELVGFVGTETRQARIDSDAGKALLDQTKSARDQVSGVNLDEEATNLVRFEQAYNATAQVIAVARSIIDTLLEATS